MKTRNTLLKLFTIIVMLCGICSCGGNGKSITKGDEKSRKEDKFNFVLAESRIDAKLKKLLCASQFITNDGEKITPQQANLDTAAFNYYFPNDDVKAFHMGLATLDSMLASAYKYNRTTAGVQKPIIGFRFYRSVSTRRMQDGVNIFNKFDLVIVPTLSMYEDLSTGTIYSHTRPCPKLCGN